MLMGMIVLLLDGRRVGAFKVLATAWLGASIIASQHRSVWVASAVAGVLIVFAIARTSRQRLVVGTLATIGAAMVAGAVAAVVRAQEQLSRCGHLNGDPQVADRQLDREAHEQRGPPCSGWSVPCSGRHHSATRMPTFCSGSPQPHLRRNDRHTGSTRFGALNADHRRWHQRVALGKCHTGNGHHSAGLRALLPVAGHHMVGDWRGGFSGWARAAGRHGSAFPTKGSRGGEGMTALHRARLAAQRIGLDFTRYPDACPDYQAFRAFTSTSPDVVLDVGANDGGFARQCRRFGFEGDIVSFEPGSQAYARLAAAAVPDALARLSDGAWRSIRRTDIARGRECRRQQFAASNARSARGSRSGCSLRLG